MFNFEQLRLRQTLSCYCSRRPPMCGTELSALPHSSALRQPRTPAVWRPSWRPGRTRTWACTSWASRPSTAPPPTMPPRTWSCCCSAGQRPTAWCSSGIIFILIPYPVQCTLVFIVVFSVYSETPLHIAASMGYAGAARILLDQGAGEQSN